MLLRQVGELWMVFPIGEALNVHNRIIQLNDTGVFLYELLMKEQTIDTLVDLIQKEYGIDEETALEAVQEFVEMMQQEGIIEK